MSDQRPHSLTGSEAGELHYLRSLGFLYRAWFGGDAIHGTPLDRACLAAVLHSLNARDFLAAMPSTSATRLNGHHFARALVWPRQAAVTVYGASRIHCPPAPGHAGRTLDT